MPRPVGPIARPLPLLVGAADDKVVSTEVVVFTTFFGRGGKGPFPPEPSTHCVKGLDIARDTGAANEEPCSAASCSSSSWTLSWSPLTSFSAARHRLRYLSHSTSRSSILRVLDRHCSKGTNIFCRLATASM